MAGYENIRDANNKRTPEERRELAKKAGKASGQARRRKADFRKTLNLLLTAKIESEWQRIPRKSAEVQAMASMRMKE